MNISKKLGSASLLIALATFAIAGTASAAQTVTTRGTLKQGSSGDITPNGTAFASRQSPSNWTAGAQSTNLPVGDYTVYLHIGRDLDGDGRYDTSSSTAVCSFHVVSATQIDGCAAPVPSLNTKSLGKWASIGIYSQERRTEIAYANLRRVRN